MLPLTNVGRTLDVLGSLPQGIDSFQKLTGPAQASILPDIIKSGMSPKVGPSASFTDIMNGYRKAYSTPANPDSPSFGVFMQEEYAPLGINKWTPEQRNQFINSFPHPYETDQINGPTDLVGMKVNEYALGIPPLKYYEEVESAADAYDQDPSSENLAKLQIRMAAFKHRKNEAQNKKLISEVEQANPYDLAIEDVAAATSQGPLDTAQQPFLEGAMGIARMTERIYSTFQGKQSAKDVLHRQQLDRAIRNKQYEQDLGPMSGVAKFAEDATTVASELTPQLALGGVVGGVAKAAGWGWKATAAAANVGQLPVIGFQVGVQKYEQARQENWSEGSSLVYGGASAAVEMATEFFMGKLVSKFGFNTAEKQFFDLFDRWGTIPDESLARLAGTRMAQAGIGEGAEEAVTEGLQKLVDHFSGMEPYEVTSPAELGEAVVKTMGDIGYAFLLGGTVGVGMAGPASVAESYAWAQKSMQMQATARKWAEAAAAGRSIDQGDMRHTFDQVRDVLRGISREFEGAQTAFFNQEEGIAWLQQQDPLIQEGFAYAAYMGLWQHEYANLVSNLKPRNQDEIIDLITLGSAHIKAELINPSERQAEAPLQEHLLPELNARPDVDQVSPEAEQYVQGWESNLTPKEAQFVYDKNLTEDQWKGVVQHRETGVASDPLVEEGEQEAPEGPVAVAEGKYEPDKTEVDVEPTDRLHDQAKQVIEEVPNATVEDVAQKLDVDEQRAEALVSDVIQEDEVVEVDDSPDAVLQFIRDNDDPTRSPKEVAEELSDTYAPDVGQRSAEDIQVVIEQIRAESKPKPATAVKPKKGLNERDVEVNGQKFKIFKQDGVWYSRDHKTGDVVDGRQEDQSPLWLGDDVSQAKKSISDWQKAGKLPGGKQAAAPQAEQAAAEPSPVAEATPEPVAEAPKAKPPALPKKPKKEPPPIIPPERKPTEAQKKAYQKLLDQADKLKNPDAETRQAAQEALSRARKEAEASNPGATKERLDELVVPLAVNIAKSNRSRKKPGYLPSLGTRSVQTVDPVPADKEAQFVQDLLAKAFPEAKFDFKVKRAGKKLIVETSDGRQVEVRLQRGGIKISKEAKTRALKDRGLSDKEAEALDVIVYGRIDTQSNIDASGIPVVELSMSEGRQDRLGNKTKWVMMEHTLRHEMLHFFYYTGLITQEDIEALRPMLPEGFSDTEALSYAAEYIDEGLMARISDAFFDIMDALGISFLLGKERLTKAKLRKIALGSTISSRLSEQTQKRAENLRSATLNSDVPVFDPETNDFSVSPKEDPGPQERTVIRYMHRDGRGLMNNQSLDRSKLTDEEEFELVDLLDFGLRQPPQGTVGTFYFTPEGEKKHARLIQLLKKASKTGVVRTTKKVPAVSWESNDGQVASDFSVSVRPTTLKLKSWAAINRLKSPNDAVTEAYLRKQGVSPNELFWTGLEDALQLSGGRMTKGEVESFLSRSNFKIDDIEETEDVRSGRDILLEQIAMRWDSETNATVELFYPNWTSDPGFLLKAFPSAGVARKAMPEILDRWIAASDRLAEDADIKVRREAVRELLRDVDSISGSSYLGGTYNVTSDGRLQRLGDFDMEDSGSIFDADNLPELRLVAGQLRSLAVSLLARSRGMRVNLPAWQDYTIGAALENAEGIEVTAYRNLLVEWNGHIPGRQGTLRLRSMQQQSHWDDVASGTNILASARLTDMFHPELGKTLIVEEIQSDLIQSIHEYKSSIETLKALMAGELAQEGSGAYRQIASQAIMKWKTAVRDLTDSDYYKFGDEQDAAERAYQKFNDSGDVKHLIFKEIEGIQVPLESKYKEMMVKRVTQEAAAGGYDTISWPSGEWHHQMYYGGEDPPRSSHVRVQSVSEVDGFYLVQLRKKEWNTDFGNHRFLERPYMEHRGLTKKGIRAVLGPILGAQAIDMIENGTATEVEVPKSEFSSDRVRATGFLGREHEFVPRYENPGLITAYRDVMPMVFSSVMKKAKVKVEELEAPLHDKSTGQKFKLKYIRLNDAIREQAPDYSLFSISIKDRVASAVNKPITAFKNAHDFQQWLRSWFVSGGVRPESLLKSQPERVGKATENILAAAAKATRLHEAIKADPNNTRDKYLIQLNALLRTNRNSDKWDPLARTFSPEVVKEISDMQDHKDNLSKALMDAAKWTQGKKRSKWWTAQLLKTIDMNIVGDGKNPETYITTAYRKFAPPDRFQRLWRIMGNLGLSPTGNPFLDGQRKNDAIKIEYMQALANAKHPDPGPWTENPADPKYKKNPKKYAEDLAAWKSAKRKAGKPKYPKFANASLAQRKEMVDNLVTYLLNKDTIDFSDAPTGLTRNFTNALKRKKLDKGIKEHALLKKLYGEIENPMQNYLHTVETLSGLLAQLETAKFIKEVGLQEGWVGEAPEDGTANKKDNLVNLHQANLPATEPLDGLVADKWLVAEIHQMFSRPVDSGLLEAYMDLVQFVKKAKTVYSFPRGPLRNDMGNYTFALMNGLPVSYTLKNSPRFFSEAVTVASKGLEALPQERRDIWHEAILHGLGEDVEIAEQGAIKSKGMLLAENLTGAASPASFGAKGKNIVEKAYDASKWAREKMRNFYQAADTKHKVMQYEFKRPLFLKAALHDAGITIQHTDDTDLAAKMKASHPKMYDTACRACAEEVRRTNPTYSLAPKIAQLISKRLPIGPFAIFALETHRSSFARMRIMSEQLKSSNPHIRQLGWSKLSGHAKYAALASALTFIFKQWAGVSDEEDEANRKRMPIWMRNSRILYLPWGEPGDRYFIDLGFSDPFNLYYSAIKGVQREGIEQAITEPLEPVYAEDIVFGTIISLMRNADENRRPVWDEGVTLDRQVAQGVNFIRKKFQPGMFDIGGKLWSAFTDGELNAPTEAASFLGFRPYPVNRRQSDVYRTQVYYRKLMSTNSSVLAALRRKRLDPDEVRAVYISAARKRQQIADEWREHMESSLHLGATDPVKDAVAILEKSKDLINNVYIGMPNHYLPSQETLDKLKELDRGYERIALIKELHREAKYGLLD